MRISFLILSGEVCEFLQICDFKENVNCLPTIVHGLIFFVVVCVLRVSSIQSVLHPSWSSIHGGLPSNATSNTEGGGACYLQMPPRQLLQRFPQLDYALYTVPFNPTSYGILEYWWRTRIKEV